MTRLMLDNPHFGDFRMERCVSDDTLPDGFSVKKGSLVAYQPYAMGRIKSLWGDDADQFKPERWLDNNGVFRPENPFKFTAFQAGPRISGKGVCLPTNENPVRSFGTMLCSR